MARIDIGNALTSGVLQPGWKTQQDGYGLTTSTCVFKIDWNGDFEICDRGKPHPSPFYPYLESHKCALTWDSLNTVTVVVDYVGIDPSFNGGMHTDPQVTGGTSLSAESITSHPKFFTPGGIAGDPAGYEESDLGPPVTVLNVTTGKPVAVKSWIGNNGACFELNTGGRFIGFVDPDYPDLYGKTQYLAPTSAFTGIMYFHSTQVTTVQKLRATVGKTSHTLAFAGVDLLPVYFGYGFSKDGKDCLLLSQISFEDYGTLFKASYEIRYNRDGYSAEVYENGASA